MRIELDFPLKLSEIAVIINGKLNARDAVIKSITTDSRECCESDLFFALKGEKYDGNDFLFDVAALGAFSVSDSEFSDITVSENAETSLLKLAKKYKEIISPKYVIAVTGSVGKTTAKDFIATMLSKKFKTHKTPQNFNNIIGLSFTLLSMKKETEVLICELGMNHHGEIEVMSRALSPNVALITNIGNAHIGNLGSREEIAKAKLEIESGMSCGFVIANKSEPLLSGIKNPYFVSYNSEAGCLQVAEEKIGSEKSELTLIFNNRKIHLYTSLYSHEQIEALVYSVAVADIVGLSDEEIISSAKLITPKCSANNF